MSSVLFHHYLHRGCNLPVDTATNFPRDHSFVRHLQKGGEGEVQEWVHRHTNDLIAVKVLKREEGVRPRELDFLIDLPENDTIITVLAYFDKQPVPDSCCIILEHCAAGDLHTFYFEKSKRQNNNVFSEAFMWSVYSQLANAVAFLHEGFGCEKPSDSDDWSPVVHCDIKPENILVASLGSKRDFSAIIIKLCDFGRAIYYDPNTPVKQRFLGTPVYWAPELTWALRRCTPASDVWAVGAVMHFLAHGFPPTECSSITKTRWIEENSGKDPYPAGCFDATMSQAEKSWWDGRATRVVIPINPEQKDQAKDIHRKRPTPRYSDELEKHLGMALNMNPSGRLVASKLAQKIEWAYSYHVLRHE